MNVDRELRNIQSKLNNIQTRQLDIIHRNITKSLDREDAEYLRKESTRTNHEIGSAEYPLDAGSETYINISNKALEKITDELNSIKESLNKIMDEYISSEATEHSNTFEMFHNCVYSVLDELNYMLYNAREEEPTFVLKCKKINRKSNVSEDDIDGILSELNDFKEQIKHLFKQIVNVSAPNETIVKKEIEESRADIIQEEMKEFREFFEGE